MHLDRTKYVSLITCVLLIFMLATASAAPREKVWVVTPLPTDSDWHGSFGNDVNDSGYIGGGWIDEDGGYHAAYWYRGDYYDLADEIGVPEDQEGGTSNVLSINNHGLMGGMAMSADGDQVAVLWDVKHDTFEDMHPEDTLSSVIWGVNASGDASGKADELRTLPWGEERVLPQPYVWPKNDDGLALPIGDSLGGRTSGINASGTVAGAYFSPIGWVQAAIWTRDSNGDYEMTDLHEELDDDTISASEAFDVNENGMVIGIAVGWDADGVFFTYAWTWTEDDGIDILDDDDVGAAIAWKTAGRYIAGSTGLLGNTADSTAAVWVRGELELLPENDDLTQSECASVNKSGLAVGYGFDKDDTGLVYPQGWYAEKE